MASHYYAPEPGEDDHAFKVFHIGQNSISPGRQPWDTIVVDCTRAATAAQWVVVAHSEQLTLERFTGGQRGVVGVVVEAWRRVG